MLLAVERTEHSPKSLWIQRRSSVCPTAAARCSVVLSHPSSYLYTLPKDLDGALRASEAGNLSQENKIPLKFGSALEEYSSNSVVFTQQWGIQEGRINCILNDPVIMMLSVSDWRIIKK